MTGSRHPGSVSLAQSRTFLKYVHVCIYVHTYKPFFSTLLYKRYQIRISGEKNSLYCATLTSVNRSILFPIQKHLSIFPSSRSGLLFAHVECVTDRWASAILSRPQSWRWAVNLDLGFRAAVSPQPNLTEWLSVKTVCSGASSGAQT